MHRSNPSFPDLPETEFDGHDWNALIDAYQQNPSPQTSEPLLTALKRPARRFCSSLPHVPPVILADDLWQEFQLTLLDQARTIRPQQAPHWTAIRLLQRTHRAIWDWLCDQDCVKTVPLGDNVPANVNVEAMALAGLEMTEEDPLYRKYILGESYEAQARRLGISAATVRQRARRRKEQLRAERAGMDR